MAARFRVIVLDAPAGNTEEFNYILWADVPAARQTYYANAMATSVWRGANGTDLTNLQSGAVVEQAGRYHRQPNANLAAIEAALQVIWQAYQDQITAFNPWQRYGSTWDGTTWVVTNGS